MQVKKVGKAVLDLLFPPQCVSCKRTGRDVLCRECINSFPLIGDQVCSICGNLQASGKPCPRCVKSPPLYSKAYSAFRFEGSVRQAVHAFKYNGQPQLANPLVAAALTIIPRLPGRTICAVPMHTDRQRQRGYNQSTLLAESFAQCWEQPLLSAKDFIRIRATEAQINLNYSQRQQNLNDAFWASPDAVAGLDFILVDDVCTTGSTFNACTESLLHAGAVSVIGITIARAV